MYTTTTPKDDAVHNFNATKDTKSDARNAANDTERKVRSFLHSASEDISHAKETVTTQIRTNPVQSSIVALGIGFVLGAMFRR